MSNQNLLLYGEDRQAPAPVYGMAGPLSFIFQDGMIKHLRIGNVEIARRIYFALRDSNWDTINPTISNVKIRQGDSTFEAEWEGHCRRGDEIDYVWKGKIEAAAAGTVRFSATGKALKEFTTPRVGICLLLSAEATLGKTFEVTFLDGQRSVKTFAPIFPRTQPASRWRSLRFRPSEQIEAEYSIEGSHFDIEDQRNFGDVTYKAMAGMPYENEIAKAGLELGQVLTIRLTGIQNFPPAERQDVFPPVQLQLEPAQILGRIPLLGINCRSELGDLDDSELSLIRDLRGILYFPLDAQASDLPTHAKRIERLAAKAQSPVCLAVSSLDDKNRPRMTGVFQQLKSSAVEILQVAYTGSAQPELALLRSAVRDSGVDIPVGKIAISTFQERAKLMEAAEAKADFLAWTSTPTCHQDDDETLMENAAVYPHQNQAARSFAPNFPISVGPIWFERYEPLSPPDPRYAGLLAAAFVATSIKYLAEGATKLATFFDAVGTEGHIYRRSSVRQPLYDVVSQPQVFPSYHVLRLFSRWRGLPVFQVRSSDPLRVAACGIQSGEEKWIVAINQTYRATKVTIPKLRSAPSGVEIYSLDESTFPQVRIATGDKAPGVPRLSAKISEGELQLTLSPYAIQWMKIQVE